MGTQILIYLYQRDQVT
jgi:hypothetical protein